MLAQQNTIIMTDEACTFPIYPYRSIWFYLDTVSVYGLFRSLALTHKRLVCADTATVAAKATANKSTIGCSCQQRHRRQCGNNNNT